MQAQASKKTTTSRVFLIALLSVSPLWAVERFEQFWPEANLFLRTSENSRLFLLAAGTRTRQDGYTDGELGVHMDFYSAPLFKARAKRHPDVARDRFLQFRVGYLFGKAPAGSEDPFTEHTGLIELTPRFYLPKQILLTNRSRVDLRFVDGEFVPRYRNRVKLERSFRIGNRALTPYAHAEIFYDWRYNAFHRQRYGAGAEFEVNEFFVVEGYYLRQQDSRSSLRGMNVGGLALQFYFP